MKKLHYIYALLFGLSLNFAACSSNDDDPVNEKEEKKELSFDTDILKIDVNEAADLTITDGGGNYHAFSENPDVASVVMDNNKVKVTGQQKGITALVISDDNGNYKRIPVYSFETRSIEIDKSDLQAQMKLGYEKIETITVTNGNGGYEASFDNTDLAMVSSVEDNVITVVAQKEGITNLTVKDMMGLSVTIPLKISTTTIPYTAEELEDLKSSNELQYTFNGTTNRNSAMSWYTKYNEMDGDLNMYGWGYYSYMYFKIWFSGDKSIGKKSPAKLASLQTWGGQVLSSEDINFEIIKNDGTYIWAVYSFVRDNKLNYGNFCQKINGI